MINEHYDFPPQVIRSWENLGYSAETMLLLTTIPLVETAWAEGFLQAAERRTILKIANTKGVSSTHPGYKNLVNWLDERPSESFFAATKTLICQWHETLPIGESINFKEQLLKECLTVAQASPGIGMLGDGHRLCREELAQICVLEEKLYFSWFNESLEFKE